MRSRVAAGAGMTAAMIAPDSNDKAGNYRNPRQTRFDTTQANKRNFLSQIKTEAAYRPWIKFLLHDANIDFTMRNSN
jgi:hypothetical protein